MIDPQTWLPAIVRSFADRVHRQQQQIYVLLRVTASYCELITNAYKHIPKGELIVVAAAVADDLIQVEVSNSGVKISPQEQAQIFDAFIPDSPT